MSYINFSLKINWCTKIPCVSSISAHDFHLSFLHSYSWFCNSKLSLCLRLNQSLGMRITMPGQAPLSQFAKCTLVIVCWFYQFANCLGSDCQLRVFDGDVEIESSELCEQKYVTADCRNFVQSLNSSSLPEGYPRDQYTIEDPINVDLISLNSPYNDDVIPGVRVTWEKPATEVNTNTPHGYLLKATYKNANGQRELLCRLFRFKPNSAYSSKKLKFIHDIQYAARFTNYDVTVASMPLSPGLTSLPRVPVLLQTSGGYRVGSTPGEWSPSVSVKWWTNGTVDVRFTLSPTAYNLTLYDVLLLKRSYDEDNSYLLVQHEDQLYSDEKPEGSVRFDNLITDIYRILVRVRDPYPDVEGMCLCWKFDLEKYCSNVCGTTITPWMGLNFTDSDAYKMRPTTSMDDPVSDDDSPSGPEESSRSTRITTMPEGEEFESHDKTDVKDDRKTTRPLVASHSTLTLGDHVMEDTLVVLVVLLGLLCVLVLVLAVVFVYRKQLCSDGSRGDKFVHLDVASENSSDIRSQSKQDLSKTFEPILSV
ncbi:uncharacterized protein LOC131927217 isoform X2 [Physella acuta]|uniref:uncharacterized protein LOC131927217 isoform X2 n=1 Tax=Physella acuta TaxID=109671 RepID=UPI0027DB737B|nr:uncharacterized protein LOC131927217 isoform X2 [Physella acuta]